METDTPDRRSQAIVALLWVAAAAFTAGLGYKRYHTAVLGRIGGDFVTYLQAAREIANGHSPYLVREYVYSPVIALGLAPFAHTATPQVWKVWSILEVAALVVGVAAFVASQSGRLTGWRLPVLFAFCAVTILHFWPVTVGLFLGQADPFVFAAFMISLWAAGTDRPITRGISLGLAGVLKTWPAALVLTVFQRGTRARARTLIGFVATLVIVPILALVVGGTAGPGAFFRSVFDARHQPGLVNDSVTGVPQMLFSHSGLAKPLLVSPALEAIAIIVLAAWVVALLVVTLMTRGDPVRCACNVTFCIVLLLPISHLAYTMYGLPVLWLWVAIVLRGRPLDRRTVAVAVALCIWWIVQTKAWPDSGSSAAISSLRYSVVFAANLVACTCSVLASRFIAGSPSDAVPAGPSPDTDGDQAPDAPTSASRANEVTVETSPRTIT